MKARTFQSRFWKDTFIRSLPPTSKLVYNYLLTNDKVNIIFCYELSDDEIKFDLGITQQQLDQAKTVLQENKKVSFYNGWIFLLNAYKYESYTGVSNEKAKEVLISQMSDEIRAWFDTPVDTPVDRGVATPPIDHRSEIIDNKSYKGDVKGEVTEEVMEEISKDYNVPLPFVKSKWDDILNYTASTGKKYKDYKATLRNWVKKDAVKIVERGWRDERKRGVDATEILRGMGGGSGQSKVPSE